MREDEKIIMEQQGVGTPPEPTPPTRPPAKAMTIKEYQKKMAKERGERAIEALLAEPMPPDAERRTFPIDEEFLPPKKERRSKSLKSDEYLDRFFRKVEIHDRHQVYIGAETYDRLVDEVYDIGGRRASVGAFVECLIQEHFKEHQETMIDIKKSRGRYFKQK